MTDTVHGTRMLRYIAQSSFYRLPHMSTVNFESYNHKWYNANSTLHCLSCTKDTISPLAVVVAAAAVGVADILAVVVAA